MSDKIAGLVRLYLHDGLPPNIRVEELSVQAQKMFLSTFPGESSVTAVVVDKYFIDGVFIKAGFSEEKQTLVILK